MFKMCNFTVTITPMGEICFLFRSYFLLDLTPALSFQMREFESSDVIGSPETTPTEGRNTKCT